MKVHIRLLILTALIGIIFLAGYLSLQENQRSLLVLMNKDHMAAYDRVLNKTLDQESTQLRNIVLDYTHWDEMVTFVKTKDSQWAKSILENTLGNDQVNSIWVYRPDLSVVYATTDLPGGVTPAIPLSPIQLQALFQKNPVLNFGFLLDDGTVMEVCGTKIVPTNDKTYSGPAQGYLFAGRIWGSARIARIAQLTDAQVDIIQPNQIQADSKNGNLMYFYTPINNSEGQPLAYVRGAFPNTFIQGYTQAQDRDFYVYPILAAIMLAILGVGIGLWVAVPLAKISSSLSSGSTEPITSLLNNRSELGRIAHLIQEFFQQRVEMANQINLLQQKDAALRTSEQRYRMITEIISDAPYSLTISPEGQANLEWGHEAMSRITGMEHIDLVMQNGILDIIHPDDRATVSAWINTLLKGSSVTGNARILKPDGEIRWIHNQMVPFLEQGSQRVNRIFGAAQDITRQHTTEETYKTLVNKSQQGMLISQDWVLKFVNPAFTEMVGNSREELLAMSVKELTRRIDPHSLRPIYKKLRDMLNKEVAPIEAVLRIHHSDNSWRWLNVLFETLEYLDRPAIHVTCVDITEHVLAEEALKKQTDYSNILFSTVNSVVVILTPDGHVTACNPAAQQICGCTNAPEGTYLWDLLEIADNSSLSHDNFAALTQNQTPLDGVEISVISNGKVQWLAWSQRYKIGANGVIDYVVGTAVNITERVFREQQREAIAGITSTLRGGTSRRETIQTILEKIYRYCDMDSVGIAFPIQETDEFIIEFVLGGLHDLLEGKRFKTNKSVTGIILQSGKAYISPDVSDEKNLAMPGLSDLIKSVAWIPLISEANTIGVLMIASKEEIHAEILDFLMPIADMAAGAIDRSERFDQARRRVQQLSALQSINVAIGASLDLNVTLKVLTVQMTTQLGVDAVDVLLLNPETNQLTFAAGNGFRSREIEKTNLWLGEGQAGKAAMDRRSIHHYDPDGIANIFAPNELYIHEDFVAYDAVPLMVKGEVRGVIETFHRQPYIASSEWQRLLEALALETSIAIDNTELVAKLQRSNQDLQVAFDGTLQGLASMLEIYDYEIEKHSIRVVDLTVKLAQYLGINGTDLTNIRRGAYLHDIGKIGIQREILNKKGKLEPHEWAEIYKHPQYAYNIIQPIPFLRPAIDIPFSHHERWNGQGYPQKLAGEQIPLAARIFAVVDIFDALTSNRPYLKTMTPQEALDYIGATAGIELDPTIARAFIELYPMLNQSFFDNLP